MSKNWWYVEGSERKGPISEVELRGLVDQEILNAESYIWTKGYENWIKFGEATEISHLLESEPVRVEEAPVEVPIVERKTVDLDAITDLERVFYIKTGIDRSQQESGAEYGPFNIDQLRRLYEESRINEKTYIFTAGMDNWCLLADFKLLEKISGDQFIEVKEEERRHHVRKPFIANMYFHDQMELYEGVCRDISVGGMQVLVSNFPGKINDEVTMNVHPENNDYSFVASGRIVRLLDGDSGFSLRFEKIGDDAKNAIDAYIESN